MALVYLTITIAKSDDKKHEQALELQRELHKEELSNQKVMQNNDFKYSAYKDFMNLFSKINIATMDVDSSFYGVTVAHYKIEFVGFIYLNKRLFLTLQDSNRMDEIAKEIGEMGGFLSEMKANYGTEKIIIFQEKIKSLSIKVNELLNDLQKELE